MRARTVARLGGAVVAAIGLYSTAARRCFVALPDASGTRLIARWRHDFDPSGKGFLTWKFGLEPIHFVMERAMLRGIKRRAEAEPNVRRQLEGTLS